LLFPSAVSDCFLFFGLGNKGLAYEKTRHNIGFRLVMYFAKKYGITLKKESAISAKIGKCVINEKPVLLACPMAYMNNNGVVIKKLVDFFKISLSNTMVVADDVNLPFGTLRLKEKGSCGGHKGLKSVENCLQTSEYPRLRLGVGISVQLRLTDYVLGDFDSTEEAVLPQIFEETSKTFICWINKGIQAAMTQANTKNKEQGENA
jgi:peptidyl-tRNA hydrolase, PTH1 family